MEFDTSGLDVGSVVTGVTFRVNHDVAFNTAGGDFTIEVYALDFGAGVTTADWQDPTEMSALTLLASYDTANGMDRAAGLHVDGRLSRGHQPGRQHPAGAGIQPDPLPDCRHRPTRWRTLQDSRPRPTSTWC